MCIFLRERARVEIDIVSIEEVLWDVRRLIRVAGIFGISSYVDSAKSDLSSVVIAEMALLDCESQG